MSTYDERRSQQQQNYDIKMASSMTTLGFDLSLPPSYSQVMAEKYEIISKKKEITSDHTLITWDNKLSEVKVAVENARQFINSTNEMMDKLRYHSIRLECKNEYFGEDLQRFFENGENNFFNNNLYNINNQSKTDQQNNAAESLTRMNFLVEDLITEAQESLTKSIPHHPTVTSYLKDTSPSLSPSLKESDKKNTPITQKNQHGIDKEKHDSLYWKKYHRARYFRSQWKLIQTMKQLIETVQSTVVTEEGQQQQTKTYPTSSTTTTTTTTAEAIPPSVEHHHIHHHYHHIYHHHPSSPPPPPLTTSHSSTTSSIIDHLKTQASRNTAIATSIFKHALQTVGIMHPTDTIIVNNPVKSRSVFYATLLLLYTLDYNMLLFRKRDYLILSRVNKITLAWSHTNSRYSWLYEKWNKKVYLIMYIVRYIML